MSQPNMTRIARKIEYTFKQNIEREVQTYKETSYTQNHQYNYPHNVFVSNVMILIKQLMDFITLVIVI